MVEQLSCPALEPFYGERLNVKLCYFYSTFVFLYAMDYTTT